MTPHNAFTFVAMVLLGAAAWSGTIATVARFIAKEKRLSLFFFGITGGIIIGVISDLMLGYLLFPQ